MDRQPDLSLPIWPEGAPDCKGDGPEHAPWLEVFRAPNPTGAAVLVCPGGGYNHRAAHEAAPVALWLNTLGVTGIVVHYRVAPYKHPQPLNDVSQAMRITRARAGEWGIDPQRVGVLGFSAGGHLAATLSTHYEKDTRPDLSILLYPVITLGHPSTHTGSRNTLLPDPQDQKMVDLLSNEKHVTSDTPPAFIFHTYEDQAVPVANAMVYADALNRAKVPFEMHIYTQGSHGVGLATNNPILATWTTLCANWLSTRNFARRPSA